mmetsp:Transcript_1541/g.2824  ORF Transcript_1541/g.2824 Transcript_1541/m.2824 type:complete len:81 (-) Transcript_1541:542-784(-)
MEILLKGSDESPESTAKHTVVIFQQCNLWFLSSNSQQSNVCYSVKKSHSKTSYIFKFLIFFWNKEERRRYTFHSEAWYLP